MLNFNDKSDVSKLILMALAVTAYSANANGQDGTYLGKVSYAGTACPKDSVKVALSSSKTTLSVSFKDYSIIAKGRNAMNIRKSCTVNIPLHIPEGWSVSLVDAKYNGNIAIPTGGNGKLVSTYSFSGRRGNSFKVNFDGPRAQNFQLRDPLSSLANVWSSCGHTAQLSINTSMRVKAPESSSASTAESTQSFDTRLRFRRCYQ